MKNVSDRIFRDQNTNLMFSNFTFLFISAELGKRYFVYKIKI